MPSSKYYCHDCAVRLAIVVPCDTSAINLTGGSHQLGKYMKHTIPDSYAGALTVFERPDHSGYLDYTVAASVSGSGEVDSSDAGADHAGGEEMAALTRAPLRGGAPSG